MTIAPPRPPRVERDHPAPAAPSTQLRRARVFTIVTLIAVLAFAGRLLQIQVMDAGDLAERALGQRLVTTKLVADRGRIVDASGVVLADNVERRNVTVDQTLVGEYSTGVEGAARDIAAITGADPDKLQENMTGDRVFAYVIKGVTPEQWRAIQKLGVPGMYSEPMSVRNYPAGPVAGNLLGFTNSEGVGAGGLESQLNSQLAGQDGERMYERGRSGQMIPTGENQQTAAVNGRDVELTINRDLQWYAQQAITAQVQATEAEWGSVVVLDVKTGDILALAESPSVDPNNPGSSPAEDRGSRALSDVFEPGSTSKVITAAAVLEEGLVTPTSRFTVPDTYEMPNGQSFRDSHPHPTEQRTFAGVLAESSNTGTVMAGAKLTKQQRYDYLRKFGLGSKSGLDFPGETGGILTTPDKWDGRQQYTVLFGQGVSLNALQSASVFATIANDGVRMTPRLVKATEDEGGEMVPAPESTGTQVVSKKTAEQVQTMLESAVAEGTGGNAQIAGYRIAGKTGTAQAPDDRGGYSGYTGSFIGMAPAGDPEIVVGVTLQRPTNGYYGGTVAAPVFRDVMTFALQQRAIPPTQGDPTLYPLEY
ncbi:MAG: peptidoglycan D,D-transpeptidase FtsI family protein [Actinomycetales bacterium]